MSQDVYVIALLGVSPGVITEMLWYLVHQEQRRITGIELWSTQDAWTRSWARLGADLARLREVVTLPAWTFGRDAPTDDIERPPGGLLVFIPQRNGRPLDDITTLDDADLFSQRLHRRLRRLSSQTETRIGALAGGRKTMTAALMSAFSLHATRKDRLTHVVLDGMVEHHLRVTGDLERYAFPSAPIAEVPPERQLFVYDVPFFSVAGFLAAGDDRASVLTREARDWLEGSRANVEGRVEVTPEKGRARVRMGAASAVVEVKTALAFAVLLDRGSTTKRTLIRDVNRIIEERYGSFGTKIAKDEDRALANLRAKLMKVLDGQRSWKERVRWTRTRPPGQSADDADEMWELHLDPSIDQSDAGLASVVRRLLHASQDS